MKRLGIIALLAVCCAATGLLSGPASAVAVTAAAWSIDSVAYPSDFSTADNAGCPASPGVFECDTYAVTATNIGAKPSGLGTVSITDTMPTGVTVRKVALFLEVPKHEGTDIGGSDCTKVPLKCVVPLVSLGQAIGPDQALKMYVSVTVNEPASAGTLVNKVKVSGGGGGITESFVSRTNTVESGHPGFGAELFTAPFYSEAGLPELQAGGHPYAFDTRIAPLTMVREDPEGNVKATSVEDIRDVIVDLPPGMAGSGVSAPQCTLARLASKGPKEEQGKSGCPSDTIIGHLRTYPVSNVSANSPIYNLVPEKGAAAELGFIDATGGTHVLYVSLAPTPAGYVLRTTSREVPQLGLTEILANVFGNPAVRDKAAEPAPATFTNPSDCDGEPLQTTILMDSWQHPGSYNPDGSPNLSDPHWASANYISSPPVTFCSALAGLFEPSLTATTTTHQAASPSGLDVALTVPQRTGAEELATPPVRDTTVTLPAGMRVNPSSANGLEACSLAQIGMSASGVPDAAPPACPDGSKIGTVEVETPALAMKVCKKPVVPLQECPEDEQEATSLHGAIYVAKQTENPFGSLLAIYIVIDDPRTGVIVKLPAKVNPDPLTGQLTTTVSDTPQFPFSQLRTHFFAGDTAALSTPVECGTYPVQTELTPWSAPESGPPATPSASFEIDEAPGGGGCSAPGFAPTLSAGTANPQAGAFSPLNVSFSRQDSDQELSGVTVTTPPGLLGTIRGIPRCPEPQASQGECSPESLIGHVSTAVGAGPKPYWVTGGRAYLTGPYNGGPFGLSIRVPTAAGPFTLTGNAGPGLEVVRASIRVDPHTGQITVLSDPLPTILEGIPLQVRTVHVAIDRRNFTFNATNCSQLATTATFSSVHGTPAAATSPYFASNCASLPFHPAFTATADAATSKPNGASLTIEVNARPGDANVAKTDIQLPKALPSRQTTLKHACLLAQFQVNPAGCPPESNIGTATVTTPVLDNPLSGPIYLVSFGNAQFPDTEIVLQGEGVTAILDGKTNIAGGITFSNFETVPDIPFTSFKASLPAGPHSILGAFLPENANNNLCGLKLTIPTLLAAQNNRQITQQTPIHINGCPTRTTIRATSTSTRKHHPIVKLTLYTPHAGSLHVTGKGIHPLTVTTATEHLQTVTLTATKRHPRRTRLTLTLRGATPEKLHANAAL